MTEISLVRLYVLRLAHLIFGGGLILVKWPLLINHTSEWPLFEGVTAALLGAMALFAILGLRYPLQMLPILLLELTWKMIWGALVFLPMWQAGLVSEAMANVAINCLVVVAFIPLIPWDYVYATFVREHGAPWTNRGAVEAAERRILSSTIATGDSLRVRQAP